MKASYRSEQSSIVLSLLGGITLTSAICTESRALVTPGGSGHGTATVSQEPSDSGSQKATDDQAFSTLVVELELGGTAAKAMNAAGTKTIYLDREHSRFAVVQESPAGSRLSISDGKWAYEVDLRARTGTKQWLSTTLASMHSGLVSDEQLAKFGMVESGTEEIAGVTCERWEKKDPYSTMTVWIWKGVQIATEMKARGMTSTERVTKIEVDSPIPDERFRVPDGISLTEKSIVGLDLLRALEESAVSSQGKTTFDRTTLELNRESFSFPTVEPFSSSRMWEPLLGSAGSKLDLDRSVTLIGTELSAIRQAFGRQSNEGPSALLQPSVPDEERVWWMMVPRILSELGPLYESDAWSEDQLAMARTVARFLALEPFAPRLDFVSSSGDDRRTELEVLGRWYLAELGHPEHYAAMVCTTDRGPYCGLPYEASGPLPAEQTVALDETRELRLSKVEDPEPYVLQCVAGDEVLWSRRISDAPARTVSHVELSDSPPEVLGTFGWKVHLSVKWVNGDEYAHLYLNPEARFLFYFVSW